MPLAPPLASVHTGGASIVPVRAHVHRLEEQLRGRVSLGQRVRVSGAGARARVVRLQDRGRRVERPKVVKSDVHVIGELVGATDFPLAHPALSCRWRLVYEGVKSWAVVRGAEQGCTHVCSAAGRDDAFVAWEHPIDVHLTTQKLEVRASVWRGGGGAGKGGDSCGFPAGRLVCAACSALAMQRATWHHTTRAGLQGWPSLLLMVYSRDDAARKDTFLSYALCPLPNTPGPHHLTLRTWYPVEAHKLNSRNVFGEPPRTSGDARLARLQAPPAPSPQGWRPPAATRPRWRECGAACQVAEVRDVSASLVHQCWLLAGWSRVAHYLGMAPRLDDDLADLGYATDVTKRQESGPYIASVGAGCVHLRLQMLFRVRLCLAPGPALALCAARGPVRRGRKKRRRRAGSNRVGTLLSLLRSPQELGGLTRQMGDNLYKSLERFQFNLEEARKSEMRQSAMAEHMVRAWRARAAKQR